MYILNSFVKSVTFSNMWVALCHNLWPPNFQGKDHTAPGRSFLEIATLNPGHKTEVSSTKTRKNRQLQNTISEATWVRDKICWLKMVSLQEMINPFMDLNVWSTLILEYWAAVLKLFHILLQQNHMERMEVDSTADEICSRNAGRQNLCTIGPFLGMKPQTTPSMLNQFWSPQIGRFNLPTFRYHIAEICWNCKMGCLQMPGIHPEKARIHQKLVNIGSIPKWDMASLLCPHP